MTSQKNSSATGIKGSGSYYSQSCLKIIETISRKLNISSERRLEQKMFVLVVEFWIYVQPLTWLCFCGSLNCPLLLVFPNNCNLSPVEWKGFLISWSFTASMLSLWCSVGHSDIFSFHSGLGINWVWCFWLQIYWVWNEIGNQRWPLITDFMVKWRKHSPSHWLESHFCPVQWYNV